MGGSTGGSTGVRKGGSAGGMEGGSAGGREGRRDKADRLMVQHSATPRDAVAATAASLSQTDAAKSWTATGSRCEHTRAAGALLRCPPPRWYFTAEHHAVIYGLHGV